MANVNVAELIKRDLVKSGEAARIAANTALNTTARSLKLIIATTVSTEVNIAAKYILDRMTTQRSTIQYLTAKIGERVYDLPAILFNPMQDKSGVTANKYSFKSAFLATMRQHGSFKTRVYRRKSKFRFPLEEIKVPIKDVSAEVFNDLEKKSFEIFKREYERNINKYLERLVA